MSSVKRIIVFLFSGAVLGYLCYLLINGVVITDGTEYQNYLCYILLFLIFIYYLVFYALKPTYIKRNKIINTLLGIFVIFFSYYYLLNSGQDGIYYGDIFSVIGVILTIVGPTNLLISKEIQKSKDDKKAEIIEIE